MAAALATQEPKLLILTGRSPSKVEEVIRTITAKCPTVKTRILELDLASIASISSAADQVHSYAEPAIDIVINNAGVMNIPERSLSVDGFEMQLAVNYLGLALFTNSIMPKLLNSSAGRVVNIVSNGYALSPFRFSDYNFEGKDLPVEEQPSKEICSAYGLPWGLGYLPAVAYGQSKTASILYTTELAARLKDKSVSVICLHPGGKPRDQFHMEIEDQLIFDVAIATDIWRQMPKEVVEVILKQLPMKSASQGTATPLVAALDPKLAGKLFIRNTSKALGL